MKTKTYTRPSLFISNSSPFLRRMVFEDSNHELDWLWAAEQVTTAEEIRYCLERAFYINPNNPDTQRVLSKLPARRANAGEAKRVNGRCSAETSNQ